MKRINTHRWILAVIYFVFFSGVLAAQDNSAELVYPVAIAGSDATVYIADRRLPGVLAITDGNVSALYKGSKKVGTPLNAVRCIATTDDGSVLVGDSATRAVYRLDDQGSLSVVTKGLIGIPSGIAVLEDGTIIVTDLESGGVWKVSDDGTADRFADVPGATGVTIQAGNIMVLSRGTNPIVKVSLDGNTLPVVTGRPFGLPLGIATRDDQTLLVADGFEKTIWSVKSDGTFEKVAGGKPFVHPVGISTGGGKTLVVDSRAKSIFEIQSDGTVASLK
ncbi:MAG: hypothetical protein ACJZ8O_02425 [Pirellulaceae bacterium]